MQFKKIISWIAIVSIIVFTLGIVLAVIFEDEIGERLLKSLNSQLKSDIEVADFELSLFSGFPEASAELNDVLIKDTWSGELLRAKKVAFRFGLLSLFGSSIKVHSVQISDGVLKIKIGKRGGNNYSIFKSSGETSNSDSNLSIMLEEANLRNIDIHYLNDQLAQAISTTVNDATFSGQFSDTKFDLKSNADLFSQAIELEGSKYFERKTVGYDAEIQVDFAKGYYDIKQLDLTLAGNLYTADGFIEQQKDYTDIDIIIESKENDINAVLQLLPQEYLAYVGDFSSSGQFDFEASINGKYSENTNPVMKLRVSLEDGRISSSKLDSDLKDVSFSAVYSNGDRRNNATSTFELSDFKGYFNRELMEMSLSIKDFDVLNIDFGFAGTVPLESVHGLFGSPSITDGDGEIEIEGFELKGRYKDMITPSRIDRVKTKGTVAFDDASLTINDQMMMIDRGLLSILNNKVKVKQVKIEGVDTEITLDGTLENLVPVLFSDSLNSKDAQLKFDMQLDAPEIDVDRLVNLSALEFDEDDVSAEELDSLQVAQTQHREQLISYLNGSFNATIDKYNYNKINGDNFKGKLIFKDKEMDIIGETSAMEGYFEVDGKLFFEDEPRLDANLVCKEINVKELFEQTENLGQSVLVADNLAGNLNAKVVINAFWDEEGTFLEDELYVIGAMGIDNGFLQDFDLLESFADYVNIKDLRNIRFVNLQNFFEIKKGQLNLPIMFIQNNALNMTLNGKYTFEHDFDFNVKINVGQTLLKLFKRHDPDLEPLPAKKNGVFNLYYKIYGNYDNYKYKSAKNEVKKDFKRSEYKKELLRKALIEEFGDIEVIYDEYTLDKDEGPGLRMPSIKDIEYWGDDEDEVEEESIFLEEIEGGSGGE